MSARLIVETAGRTYEFAPGSVVSVGRAAHNDLTLDSGWVSREHATIRWTGTSWTIEDHSKRGTFQGGTRQAKVTVDGPLILRLGDPTEGPELRIQVTPAAPASPGDRPGSAPRSPRRPGRSTPVQRSRIAAAVTRIGRASDNDLVLGDDLTVSRHHAELHRSPDGSFELVDIGSKQGTYVDGLPIRRARLVPGQVVRIGGRLFELDGDTLVEYLDDRATLVADRLTVTVAGGTRLLDGVSFSAEPGQLVAIVGPSGAGKSTLVKALTGTMAASGGQVLFNRQDLHSHLDDFRSRMGMLPQDDILHPQLRTRAALGYAAALRFADDTTAAERDQRIDEVMGQLGLDQPQIATLPIARLSGGQRKRASLALELLTRPALLLCDEPTTGLDLHREREVMQVLRGLADEGRTVLVITHTVASLDLCDRVLCLAAGGRMAYYGPPAEALDFFGLTDWVSLFALLEDRGRDFAAAYDASPDRARYAGPPPGTGPVPVTGAPGYAPPPTAVPVRRASAGRQFRTLVRRNLAVIAASRGYALMLALQAPLIAFLIVVAVERSSPRVMVLLLALSAVSIGLVNGCREIVRELPIYRRERAVGLSRRSYLAAKATTVIGLVTVQCVVLTALVLAFKPVAAKALLFGVGPLELTVVVCLVGAAAVAMGLALSAWVRSDASALVAVPVVIVACLLLAGAFLPVHGKPGLEQVAWLSPSYWGVNGLAASADAKRVEGRCEAQKQIENGEIPGLPDVPLPGSVDRDKAAARAKGILGQLPCPAAWDHNAGNLAAAILALLALIAGYLALAAAGLRRHDRAG